MTNRQIQHELELSRLATDKIRNDLQKAKDKKYSSKQPFIQDIIRDLTFPFKDALVKATSRTSIRKATTTPYALGYKPMQDLFSLVDPDVVAFISITKILDEFYVTNHNLPIPSEAARRIASSLEDEHRIQYYLQSGVEGVEKALYKETHTKGSTPAYMRTGAKLSAEKLLLNKYGWDKDDLHKPWGNDTRFNVGLFVLEAAVEFGMLEKITLQLSKKKKRNHLKLSPTAEALAKKYQQHFEERTIFKHPLIDTPKEWETQYGLSRDNISGGYYQAVFKQYLPLCRDFNSETSFSKDTINLLNTLGRTAWNIDNDVYKIARDCFDKGWTVAGLNSVSHPAILDQKMPQWIVDKGKKDPEYKDWKSTKAHAYTKKKEEESKSVSTRKALVLASEYIKEPRFYLSWSCDYRGRMYSQQSFLDQQKNDSQRALVTFADGCRLDERGMNWAANAIGAAYRGSKITYKDRSDWTYSNKELIAAIANDPLGTIGEWERVDAPWQFLQLAMEWNRVVLKKDKAIWDVPIGADSTSSGLQLLSAMRRDPVGMKFSNLLAPSSSSEPPQDAYKEVMRIARKTAYKNPETARLTEYLEDRALGKVILMKIIYGATSQTNIREVKEYFIDKGLYGFTVSWEDVLSITKIL